MPKRETVFASAILAALVPVMVLSVGLHHAQGAADNCLARPNAAPPQGSHWYYRVDQAGNRRCWFLAPEGAPRQALSPKPAPNPPPKRASQPKATATAQPGPAQHRRKLVAVPRIAEIARPPADEWDPDHDIEALDAEESLQQFLPRWRRVAA
jgi:hypothetical protein